VAAAKGKHIATMLDTKGPEIRTAMLKGGGPLELKVCGSMPRHAL
jgi:pyruvate kinase